MKGNLVCRWKKSLYGLKKYPRKWYLKFDKFWPEEGYSRCYSHHYVYFKRLDNGIYIILLLYVYDLLVARFNIPYINVLKWKLAKSFVIKDLSVAKQILGMRITRDMKTHKLTLSWGEHIQKVLDIFRMQNQNHLAHLLSVILNKVRRCVPI